MRKWIKIKPAIWITFIPAKMHNIQPAITKKIIAEKELEVALLQDAYKKTRRRNH
jgi:hypothetical protein